MQVLVIGEGHLARRVSALLAARGDDVTTLGDTALGGRDLTFQSISQSVRGVDLAGLGGAWLVDDRDERNLGVGMALISLRRDLPMTMSLFNENIAPHLTAANPTIRVLNPAKIAAPRFIAALDLPLSHSLRYTPGRLPEDPPGRGDALIKRLVTGFAVVMLAAVSFFHFVDHLSWLDATYFVVVTVATVGYGDINVLNSGPGSKLAAVALILASTLFIWLIFSLTVDAIIKKRVQLALGRRRYAYEGHVVLCGLGRLGYFIAEGLLARGERIVIVEREEGSPSIDHFRRHGVDVYIGDARLARVLQDVRAGQAKALISVINNDYFNLEIGLNARSFNPDLRLVLRIFDDEMSRRIKDNLDIHLTYSMTGIADEHFVGAV